MNINGSLKICENPQKENESRKVITVIAGSGNLPYRIIDKLKELGRKYIVISIRKYGPEEFISFNLGEIGKILEYIKKSNASEVLFCGAVKRPSMFSLKLDSLGKKWFVNLGIRAFLGDDSLLKGIKKLLSKEGIEIISPQNILETLITKHGILTETRPSDINLQDIARGIFVLNATSKADIGQSVVVQEGIVLGIEAAEGTQDLIVRCKSLKISEKGGVLVKTSKTNQDYSIDLPTIGKETILAAEYSGLSGIALGAEKSQIIDFEDTIKLANEKGIFIIGI